MSPAETELLKLLKDPNSNLFQVPAALAACLREDGSQTKPFWYTPAKLVENRWGYDAWIYIVAEAHEILESESKDEQTTN